MSLLDGVHVKLDPKAFNELGAELEEAKQILAAFPLLDGRLISLAWTATQVRLVDHGLGRPIRGWWELTSPDQTARCALTPAHVTGVDLKRQVRIRATNAGTCLLWVF